MKKYTIVLIVAAAVLLLQTSSSLRAESIRFAVVGDTQADQFDSIPVSTSFSKIVQLVLAADPPVQFVVQTGDLIKGDYLAEKRLEQFQYWRSIAAPWYEANFTGLKVYPTPGNHDQNNPATYQESWQEAFPELPDNGPADAKKMTYSFDIGPCHFIVVNTSIPNPLKDHTVNTEWLSQDLAATTQPVIFVFGHEPAFPAGLNMVSTIHVLSLDARPNERDAFWKILADRGVKAYFCGHEHVYDHWIKDHVHQIITGTAGISSTYFNYLIVDVADDNSVIVSVYNATDNSLIDQFDLADTKDVPSEDRPVTATNAFCTFIDSSPCTTFLVFLVSLGYIGLRAMTPGRKMI